ncbi:hypothetical protein [Devosia sp. Root105]|uniref:hypothetical protein n=1 Tax=Devosia sp. Root105 TaxID=1736423 RepID=UPI0006F41BC9|nr:hypothetical protein [Devosia sp. Root105]KQU96363.1 hypothetical protein ASC68_13365 [Devosia sp. Root105]
MTISAADTHTEMAMQWCATFTEADYPRCRQIAYDMVEQATRERLDEPMFAYKSIAQSLHFLGEHAEAKRVAERVRREAKGFIPCTSVHPYVSMGIVLARIACLTGDGQGAVEIAADTLARSRRDNLIANCHAIALACAPIAIWTDDEQAARSYAFELMEEAGGDGLNYWRNWGRRLLRAIDLRFNPDEVNEEPLEVDNLDAIEADHLATVDGRAISELALRRVAEGTVGWTKPEVLRTQASTAIWFDPAAARRLLAEARATALEQGAIAWVKRIDETAALHSGRFLPPHHPTLGP